MGHRRQSGGTVDGTLGHLGWLGVPGEREREGTLQACPLRVPSLRRRPGTVLLGGDNPLLEVRSRPVR